MIPFPTPPLTTRRLVLRRRVPADAALVRALWAERDPRVPEHRRIDAAGHPTAEEIAAAIDDQETGPGRGLLTVTRADTGAGIGYCGLVTGAVPGRPEAVEIAFELLAAHQGRGYATEAARAVLAWGEAAEHASVWATVWAWNTPSLRVLAKLGFRDTGRGRIDPVRGPSLLLRRDA